MGGMFLGEQNLPEHLEFPFMVRLDWAPRDRFHFGLVMERELLASTLAGSGAVLVLVPAMASRPA